MNKKGKTLPVNICSRYFYISILTFNLVTKISILHTFEMLIILKDAHLIHIRACRDRPRAL